MVSLTHLADDFLQIAHLAQIPVGTHTQDGNPFERIRGKQIVVVCRHFIKDRIQLFIVMLQPQQLPPPADDAVECVTVPSGKNFCLAVVNFGFKLIEICHVAPEEMHKKVIEQFLISLGRCVGHIFEILPDEVLGLGIFAEKEQIFPVHVNQNLGVVGAIAVDVIPIESQQIKRLEALETFSLSLVDIPKYLRIHIRRSFRHAG